MARLMFIALLLVVFAVVAVRAHVAQGKQPQLKTIANIVVHPHHDARLR